MREDDTIHYFPSFHIAKPLVGDEEREDDFNLIGKNFRDYFVYDIGEGYGPKVVQGIRRDYLGNQSQESRFKGFKDRILSSRFLH